MEKKNLVSDYMGTWVMVVESGLAITNTKSNNDNDGMPGGNGPKVVSDC